MFSKATNKLISSDETSIALTAIAATYPLKIKCYIKCMGEMGDFVNMAFIINNK
jgi:hypothetical protein